MKGLFFVCVVAVAGLAFWGWSNSGEVSKLNEQNMELKKQLAESAANVAAEKATQVKLSAALADTESRLAVVNKKVTDMEQQIKTAAATAIPVIIAPKPVTSPAAINVPPDKQQPTPAELATAAQAQQLKSELSKLKQQSLDLTNKKGDLQRKLAGLKNKLYSGGGRETGWYYLNDSSKYIHSMSEKIAPGQKAQYVFESKESVRAKEIAPYQKEMAEVISQKTQIESQITQKQSALDKL